MKDLDNADLKEEINRLNRAIEELKAIYFSLQDDHRNLRIAHADLQSKYTDLEDLFHNEPISKMNPQEFQIYKKSLDLNPNEILKLNPRQFRAYSKKLENT